MRDYTYEDFKNAIDELYEMLGIASPSKGEMMMAYRELQVKQNPEQAPVWAQQIHQILG